MLSLRKFRSWFSTQSQLRRSAGTATPRFVAEPLEARRLLSVSFAPAAYYATGNGSQSVTVGDFTGDGKADLAVANLQDDNVSVLLGNGNGTFQPAVNYAVDKDPASVAVGDINGDGHEDLAVANYGDNTVSVLLGNGNGTFHASVKHAAGSEPSCVTVGDFNGDGKADLAVADDGGGVSVLLGNGNGTFHGAVNYAAGNAPSSVTVGDFNGDGKADLAVANAGDGTVSVLLGNGNGTFQPAVNYAAGNDPNSVTVGDFTSDGNEDLAVANEEDGTVSVLLGNGDGTFQLAVNYAAGSLPMSVTVGDFTSDGHEDLAVANYGDFTVSVLLGNGNGTFQPAVNDYAGSRPVSVTEGDFNGDDKADLAVADFAGPGVGVLLNTTLANPVFSNLTSSSSISYGTGEATFSGTIAAGNLVPPATETMAITLDGTTQNAAISANGSFTATFNTSTLPVSATPYQVTYAYGGDANFNPATDNTTTKLTVTGTGPASIAGTIYANTNGNLTGLSDVMVYVDTNNNGHLDAGEISVNTNASGAFLIGNLAAGTYTVREVVPGGYAASGASDISVTLAAGQAGVGQSFLDVPTGNASAEAVYRLYSPVTLEHLYTTDANEYNTLESYVGTWNGEGQVFNEYSGNATVGGVTDEPYYRLYNPFVKQHLWTTDLNEYTTLATEGWEQEGIVGYVFPATVAAMASCTPLYRLMAPNVHLWTTTLNEYDTLQTEGWTGEGIIGYVV